MGIADVSSSNNSPAPDLSVVIPARNEAENLAVLIPRIWAVLRPFGIQTEIIVVDELSDEETRCVTSANRARLFSPAVSGYAQALVGGMRQARGEYVVTMDADLSHSPEVLATMWRERRSAEVLVASRYVPGGKVETPTFRSFLSRVLNMVINRSLDLNVRDVSSGYRMYRRKILDGKDFDNQSFDVLQEILVRLLMEGYRIREIPCVFRPRQHGSSHASMCQFALAYVSTFGRLWRARNSIAAADYDYRAYKSWLIIQQYWQRTRFRHIVEMIQGHGACLDVGCGSSRIVGSLAPGSIALDISMRKLRFARRYEKMLVQGSAEALPIRSGSFACVVCSQVIEHIHGKEVLQELDRVVEPGGVLVLGTPDYANWQWVFIEWVYKLLLPQAYADEHISHYTCHELVTEFCKKRGYELMDRRYILRGELILKFRAPVASHVIPLTMSHTLSSRRELCVSD